MHFPERLPEGSLLGGYYRVTRFLGAGGMADVYAGVQTDTGAEIAVKILKPAHDPSRQEVFNTRFLREAQIAASLAHNHVVRIIAFRDHMALRLPDGQQGDFARPYLVMERLRGHDLSDEIKDSGPLEPERAVKLLLGALDGLAEGHKRGVVHKDLKPSNLFLVDPGHARREKLVVLDFGVARLGQGTGETLTASGQVATTAAYAAPEYIREQRVTPALDVYQMGLVLAEALTGEPVVKLDTSELTPEAYMMACAVRHASGVKLPPLLLRRPALAALLQRAIHLDPDQRYADAGQMCDALEELPPQALLPWTEAELSPKAGTPAAHAPQPPPAAPPLARPATPARKGIWVFWLGLGASLMLGAVFLGLLALGVCTQEEPPGQRPAPSAVIREPQEDPPPPEPCQGHREAGVCLPMIQEGMALVPEGEFTMGDNGTEEDVQDERPAHEVYLDRFWIDVYEVSVARYKACVEAGVCTEPVKRYSDDVAYNWGAPGRGEHPVNGVTWRQAREFCQWKGKRLPTEAQWEKAARGPQARVYPWGERAPDCELAWLKERGAGCGSGSTTHVDAFPAGASPYGVQQLSGNVWEWVWDWYREEGYGGLPARNPQGPSSGSQRVLRGGSWYSDPDDMRASNRYAAVPAVARSHFGFRCARDGR